MSSSQLILIIESNASYHENLIEKFADQPYQLLSAYTSDDGVIYALNNHPDLILINTVLATRSGYDVCCGLRTHTLTSDIPIIMFSQLHDVNYRIRAIEAGADVILQLPINHDELLAHVRSLLKSCESRKKLAVEHNHLHTLSKIDQVAMQRIDLDELIHTIIEETQNALGASEGILIITDENGRSIRRIVGIMHGDFRLSDSPVDHQAMSVGFAGWIWENRSGAVIADIRWDNRWIHLKEAPEAGSAIGVPLFHADQSVYGIMIFSHESYNLFDNNHLILLEMIANQVTSALQNAQLYTAVRDEQGKLAAILAKTSDAIITTDQDGYIERLNQAAGIMLQTSLQEAHGQFLGDMPYIASIASLLQSGKPTTQEFVLNDGRIISVNMSPIPDVGIVLILHDITMQREQEQARYTALEDTFKPYISSSLYELAIGHRDNLIRREAVVLFADLRNHTQLVSACEPDQVISFLNHFFEEMTQVVYQHNGVIIDLIGDELEVCFNVHEPQDDAVERAVHTAIAMQKRFNDLRPFFLEQSGVELGLGIGIDIGKVIVGQVGSQSRKSLALVGRAVNTAHRMVDMAQDGYIVIGRHFHELFVDNRELSQLFGFGGFTPIKGLDEPIAILMAYTKPYE